MPDIQDLISNIPSDVMSYNGTLQNSSTALTPDGLSTVAATLSAANGGIPFSLGAATSLIDCARSIEDRIMDKIFTAALDFITAQPQAQNVLQNISVISKYAAAGKTLLDFSKKARPLDLVTALSSLKGLSGSQLEQQITNLQNQFGSSVQNLNQYIEKLDVLNICDIPNVYSNGQSVSRNYPLPTSPPAFIPPLKSTATFDQNQIDIKNQYDDLMFRLKESTGRNFLNEDDNGHTLAMLSAVNTIVMAYHDKIYKSISNEKDSQYYNEYTNSIRIEKSKYSNSWSSEVMNDFITRTSSAGNEIQNGADVIRAYGLRLNNNTPSGSLLSTGITTYSPPQSDFTTFLDIKPEQRPPELTAYWQSRGYNIEKQIQKGAERNIKYGTLNLSDTTQGAYGSTPLKSDVHAASCRVPGGSILALRKPDGTPYDPTGKNPSGLVTVVDVGNAALTYNKPDIFTESPELYKNMDSVQVYLVSRGSKTHPQYVRAQEKYGGQNVV